MSRFFNGPTTADRIQFSAGTAPPDQGPVTVAVLSRLTYNGTFTGWAIQGRKTSSGVWAVLVDSGVLFCENDFGSGGPAHVYDHWCWYVLTKGTGSVVPRWHRLDISAGTAWVHQNDTGNVGDGSGPIDNIYLGGNGSASNTWRGRIAAAAAWSTALSDVQVEAACTLAAADLLAASPGWMVRLNQASTATSVLDDTGNGGDQSAISGTTVDADEPPGWDYALTGSSGPAVTVWDGAAEVAATVTVWDGTTEQDATVDEIVA